jgi:hypothetical protein
MNGNFFGLLILRVMRIDRAHSFFGFSPHCPRAFLSCRCGGTSPNRFFHLPFLDGNCCGNHEARQGISPQAALFSSLFYFIAWAVSRVLRRVIPKRFMAAVVVGIVMAFFAASVFDIYRLPGHNSSPPGNILNILRGRS